MWDQILNALESGKKIIDKDGRNVLSIAILNNAPLKVINKIIDISPEFLLQPNKEGSLPMHFALSRDHPNKRLINKMYYLFPDSLYISNKHGLMPIQVINDASIMQYIERLTSHGKAGSSSSFFGKKR